MQFEQIYPKYKNLIKYYLLPVAHRTDINDIFQEVLIKIFRFSADIRKPSAVRQWLKFVVKSTLKDKFRSEAIGVKLYPYEGEDQEIKEAINKKLIDLKEPSVLFEEKITANSILEIIEQIPEPYQISFRYKFLFDWTYEEIAKITEVEVGTVKSRVYRGRTKFEELYALNNSEDKRNNRRKKQ